MLFDFAFKFALHDLYFATEFYLFYI